MMTNQETTLKIRQAIKAAGIRATCKIVKSVLEIGLHGYAYEFTTDEQAAMLRIAGNAGVTYISGLPEAGNAGMQFGGKFNF